MATYQQPGGAQAAQIFQAFLGTTYQPNAMDVQHEPLYDQLSIAQAANVLAGSQSQAFFAQAAGRAINLTNVQTPKKLDAPEAFAVMAIQIHVDENILIKDFIALNDNMVLEFYIGQKSYNRGPIWYYTAGGGISGFSGISNAQAVTNGIPGANATNPREINIVIDNQASFYAWFNGTQFTLTATASGGVGLLATLVLDGFHARGVQ
jgi:hypothetical protein